MARIARANSRKPLASGPMQATYMPGRDGMAEEFGLYVAGRNSSGNIYIEFTEGELRRLVMNWKHLAKGSHSLIERFPDFDVI